MHADIILESLVTMNHLGDINNTNRLPITQSVEEQALGNQGSEMSTPNLPKMCHAFSRYRKYLHSYYNRNPIVCDDKLSIAPCSQFINLALVKEDDQINSFTKSTLHGGVDEINKSKIPVGMDTIVTSDSQFILVEGPPGIGKSTLCWELCRQWDTLKSLKDYKIVLQLKLREKRVQNTSSLQEIFYHDDKKLSLSVVKTVFGSEGEGVLLIFDGFDEMPTSIVRDRSTLIMRLIHGNPTCLPRATRLVTSRPSALHHKEKCFPQGYRHIEILGFTSDELKVRYAELAFKSEPEVLASFKKFLFSNPIIKSLMYIPVNCAIISQVYKDIRRSRKLMPKTMTQLYSTLIPVLIKRYMIEKGEWDSHHGIPSDLEDLPKDIVLSLSRVSELAYNGLLKEDIQLMFTESDVGEGFQHLGLLSETKEMYVCEGAVSSYSFLHLSIQEFLAAWHVRCHPELKLASNPLLIKAKPPFFSDKIGYLTTFGYFIAGMIGYDLFELNFSPIYSTLFLVMCMYEAQDCSRLSSDQCLCIIPSNPMEMYAFGYVLVHSPIPWHLCNIKVPSFDILASSLSDHASSTDQIQGSIVGLTIEILNGIELRLPKCLLHSITTCSFSRHITASVLLKLLPNLINMRIIEIDLSMSINQDDYLLYEMLRHFPIKVFELMFEHITLMGIQELSTTLSSSSTIEDVTLKCYLTDPPLSELVEAALSSSTIISLQTNIPFHIPPTQYHNNIIETMVFEINPMITNSAAQLKCLLCIAKMCRIQSMKELHVWGVYDIIPPQDYANFLRVLNDSLYQNPSMCSLKILPFRHFNFEEFPHMISKDHVTVRRSKSLSDIATAIPILPQHVPIQSGPNSVPAWQSQGQDSIWTHALGSAFQSQKDIPEDNGGFQHSKSCGNLLSLYDHIHPLLYKALFPLKYIKLQCM